MRLLSGMNVRLLKNQLPITQTTERIMAEARLDSLMFSNKAGCYNGYTAEKPVTKFTSPQESPHVNS